MYIVMINSDSRSIKTRQFKKIIIWSEFKILLYAQISRTFVHRKSNMDVQTYISKYIRLHTQYRFNGFVSGRNLIKKYRNIFLDL